MKAWSAGCLGVILAASLLTAWVPLRWPVSILETGSYALALAWMVRLVLARKLPRGSLLLLPLGVNVAWGVVQRAAGWTWAPSDAASATLNWAAYLALAFAAIQTFPESAETEAFLRAALWCGAALCIVSTLQSFTSPDKVFWYFPVPRPVFLMGPFLNHGQYSAFVELLLPLALIGAVQTRRPSYGAMAGVMVASVIASASRGGFAMVVIEVLTVLAFVAGSTRDGWRRIGPTLGVIVALTASLTAVVGWESLTTRLALKGAYFDRGQMLLSSIAMIRDHPWVGVGLGCWPTAFPFYARYDTGEFANQAHNDWAQWAAEGGIPMLASQLFLLAWAVRRIRSHPWIMGPVFVLAHAFFDYPFQKPAVAALAFVLLATGATSMSQRKRSVTVTGS